MKVARLSKAVCPTCGGFTFDGKHVTGGNRMTASVEQIEGILRNHLMGDKSGSAYCTENEIGIYMYHRIINLKIKNPVDRARIRSVAASLGYRFEEDAECWVKSHT